MCRNTTGTAQLAWNGLPRTTSRSAGRRWAQQPQREHNRFRQDRRRSYVNSFEDCSDVGLSAEGLLSQLYDPNYDPGSPTTALLRGPMTRLAWAKTLLKDSPAPPGASLAQAGECGVQGATPTRELDPRTLAIDKMEMDIILKIGKLRYVDMWTHTVLTFLRREKGRAHVDQFCKDIVIRTGKDTEEAAAMLLRSEMELAETELAEMELAEMDRLATLQANGWARCSWSPFDRSMVCSLLAH